MVSVNFNVKADFSSVDRMLNRYGNKAVNEYAKAVSKTSLYGVRELKETSPVVTSNLQKHWFLKVKNKLATSVYNETYYANKVNTVKRKRPVGAWAKRIAKSKKILRSKIDGYKFIDKAVTKMQTYLNVEINKANRRLLG